MIYNFIQNKCLVFEESVLDAEFVNKLNKQCNEMKQFKDLLPFYEYKVIEFKRSKQTLFNSFRRVQQKTIITLQDHAPENKDLYLIYYFHPNLIA